jgi:hypothetical protein
VRITPLNADKTPLECPTHDKRTERYFSFGFIRLGDYKNLELEMGTYTSPGKDDFVTALLSAEMIEALDRHIREKAPGTTRSDALRTAVREWCVDRKYCDHSR